MPTQDPTQDRKQTHSGFMEFRKKLADEGRLRHIPRPAKGQTKTPVRQPSERVNVLWLMADQLRADTFGFMGHPMCKTPNLDRLAAEGAFFTRSFCSEPVCAPSRAAMLTGHYNYRNGVLQNGYPMREGELTWPKLMTDAGYRTASIGKTHCGRSGSRIFEYNQGVKDAFGATKPSDVPFVPGLFPDADFLGGKPVDNSDWVISGKYPGPPETTKSYNMANQAIKWLYWNDDPRPFLLRVSFDDPHPPVVPPEPYASMYSPDEIPEELVAAQTESMEGKPRTVQEWQVFHHMDMITERQHRKHIARYFGLVTHLDAQIGRILDYLEETEFADNTIVILNSDHGQMTGEHGLVHKGPHMYEGVTRIPTIVRWPGQVQPGTRIDALAEGVDLMPTVLEMTGIDCPDVDGKSWCPLLKGDVEDLRDFAFVQWEDYVFCIRGKRWKLAYFVPDDDGELYDMDADPLEKVNLYHDPAHSKIRQDLMRQLDEWRDVHARPEQVPLTTA